MTTETRPDCRTVFFCFADPKAFSGQKAATELLIHGFSGRGWLCHRLPQPVLDRDVAGENALPGYVADLVRSWIKALGLLKSGRARLCVNLGQSLAGFLRDAVPLFIGRMRFGRARVIIALHGSVFMRWADHSLEVRVFRFLLRSAGVVTVLGETQRSRLIAIGVPPERGVVVVNSCNLAPASAESVVSKHDSTSDRDRPVRLLHLSSLIDTKGFPEYLEALRHLSDLNGPRIDAILCGRVVASEFSSRFQDMEEAADWIGRRIEEINRSDRVRVRWIKGAAGADKAALFREADVFVFPTRYAVEAQPLVLLEAMASGCAIVTTRAGEIPTILDEQCSVFLAEVSADAVASALQALVADRFARKRIACAAHARFVGLYSIERHLDAWERLLRRPVGAAERQT